MARLTLFFSFFCAALVAANTAREICKDNRTKCPLWKSYCTRSNYGNWMTKNCRKTCGACYCGKPEVAKSRVIGGINAKRGSWPWQTLMIAKSIPMCGGSLIAPQWVVTAAHCLKGYTASEVKVRVGEHNRSTTNDGPHKDIQVSKIVSHPSYGKPSKSHDIGLLKLAKPVVFGKYVKPVCLPYQDEAVPAGTRCFITGWGRMYIPGEMSSVLQQGEMPVVSNTDCEKANRRINKVTDDMLCAGDRGATWVNGCHGDSGGPFVCKTGSNGSWVLHGAVSWGSGMCNAYDAYTVFARVSKFRDWIDETMRGDNIP